MIETIKINSVSWHHILDPDDEDFRFLRDTYHFHPLDIEDCRSVNQRPKIDIYPDYYFLILHFPNFDRWERLLKTREVKVFWGIDFVITIGRSHWVVKDLFNSAKDPSDIHGVLQVESSDALLYKILEHLMIETFALIKKIGIEVELINRDLFNTRAEKTIERISLTRRNIILIDTIFKPQLKLFQKFESGEISGFQENMNNYWGNILDYYQKMWDMIEDYEEIIEGLSKTFDSLQTNRTNEIIKVLTFFSSIMLPLTLITSLYGMNIKLPYQEDPHSFLYLMGVSIAIVVGLLYYFRRRKWL